MHNTCNHFATSPKANQTWPVRQGAKITRPPLPGSLATSWASESLEPRYRKAASKPGPLDETPSF